MDDSTEALRELITIKQLSALWNLPAGTLYNWVSQGRIPYVKLGRLLRFNVALLEEVRKSSTREPKPVTGRDRL
jgi:excisionase family DNA binding protein